MLWQNAGGNAAGWTTDLAQHNLIERSDSNLTIKYRNITVLPMGAYMKKIVAILSFINLLASPAAFADAQADFINDLNDEGWDRAINGSRSSGGGGGYSRPNYYWGVIYGNVKKGSIGYSYGGLPLQETKQAASAYCTKEYGNCEHVIVWNEGCMAIAWSSSLNRFFHSTPTSGLKDEEKAISSAMKACKASGATDCKMKGDVGDQAICTFPGYVEKTPINYRAISGNFEKGTIWFSDVSRSLKAAKENAAQHCEKNYGNCQFVVSWDSGCMGIAWSSSQKRFFYSTPTTGLKDEEKAISSALKACNAAGATDCKVADQAICTPK